MKVMLLAAGFGTRLNPLTKKTPKALIKVKGKALIDWHIEKLIAAGFDELVINISHLKEKIINHLSNKYTNINIQLSLENSPLETLGGIYQALGGLSDPFIVINSDIYTDYDYSQLAILKDQLGQKQTTAHLVLVKGEKKDFSLQKDLCLKADNGQNNYTFSGIACYKKAFFNLAYAKNEKITTKPLAPWFYQKAKHKQISATIHQGFWYDVGSLAVLNFLNNK